MSPKTPHLLTPERHDWSSRARSTAMDALRYTQFVGIMKRALPVAAFAVISAVVAYFFVARQPSRVNLGYERMGHVENDLAMIKPRLTGQDSKGNPFVITAEAAIQDAKNTKRARLTKVEADLNQGEGWINANAATGLADMDAGVMQLDGCINIFSDTGYELHTKSASVDLKKGVMHGHDAVTGQGPMGDLRADQFHYDRDTKLLTLSGNVRMTILAGKT